ncbi:MAG: carbohydrate binding domain-containing protein [Candidatus Omnitrophota bacterium]
MGRKPGIRVIALVAMGLLFLRMSAEGVEQMFKIKNPIQNHSFEQVTKRDAGEDEIKDLLLSGWKFDPANYLWHWRLNPSQPGTIEVIDGVAHTGNRCVKLGGNGALYYIYGEVKKKASYRVSVWAKGKGEVTLFLYLYSEKGFSGCAEVLKGVSLTEEWKEYSAVYNAGDLQISAINPGVTASGPECYLDDFNFAETEIDTKPSQEGAEKEKRNIEVTFKKSSDLDYLRNLTPEIITFKQEGLFSTSISALQNGINLDGLLLFDDNKHQGSETSMYDTGTYTLDFILRPAGGYWFGIMLGSELADKRSFVYFKQPSVILCYACYNGGAYTLVLSVDGNKKESRTLGTWVWDTQWYRMILNVKSDTDISVNVVNLSSNEIVDTLSWNSPTPVTFLPAKLWIITETSTKMIPFLRVGKFTVIPK